MDGNLRWVFTHRDLAPIPGVDITFVSGDIRPVHKAMVEAAKGKNVWLTGGGVSVHSLTMDCWMRSFFRWRP